jgi:hypothetical protein
MSTDDESVPAGARPRRRIARRPPPARQRRWADLTVAERKAHALRAFVAVSISWVVLFGAYYLAPFDNTGHASTVGRIIGAATVFLAGLGWQVRRITRAGIPEVRAMQALGVIVPLFFVLVASTYLWMSVANPANFTEPLDHASAMYFTVTVFSTVGFGDITPKGDLMRSMVAIQMVVDLALIAALARLLFTLARRSFRDPDYDGEASVGE